MTVGAQSGFSGLENTWIASIRDACRVFVDPWQRGEQIYSKPQCCSKEDSEFPTDVGIGLFSKVASDRVGGNGLKLQ